MITTIEDMKRQAKRIARATTVTHAQALDVLAVQNGFSHWTAYSRHLDAAAMPYRPFVPEASGLQGIIETAFGRSVPAASGCRHLIVSGVAGSGKTTLINRIIETLAPDTRVVAIEDVKETNLPPGGVSIAPAGIHPNIGHEHAFAQALELMPDIVVCGFTGMNVVPVIDTMTMKRGPIVIATIHVEETARIRRVVEGWTADMERPEMLLPDDVMAFQLMKDHFTGRRTISEIQRI